MHIIARWDGGLHIDRDVFGCARLLTTEGNGYAALSDSLTVLAELRRAMGDRVTPHEQSLLARVPRTEIVGGQTSPQTIATEISFVPPGHGLRLSRWTCSWRLTGTPLFDRLSASPDSYTTGIREGAANIGRVMATLMTVPRWRTSLSLSGGYDSRLVLAAASASGVAHKLSIDVTDTGRPELADDVNAAVGVARALGLNARMHDLSPQTHKASDRELTEWAASLLGVYDGYGPVRGSHVPPRTFPLQGLGAGAIKGAWGWIHRNALVDRTGATGEIREAVDSQLRLALRSLGASEDDPRASELFYLGYRNSLHGTAHDARLRMTGVNPLMQWGLARLGHSQLTPSSFAGSGDIIIDMAAVLSPEIASHPYDSPARARRFEHLTSRCRELGGTVAQPKPLEVYGHPDDVVAGPSHFSLNVARSAGFLGALAPEPTLARAKAALDVLPTSGLRAAYLDMLANARWRMEKSGPDVTFTGVTLPRLSALDIFTGAGSIETRCLER
ncbi:hypothetical protein [Microbacterium amylolyticum]|uniref:Asparagine synthetase domain-containing protein n=1 Tax=Microbacterium amylolyticum TaxID=936337 RepID=A0ABS4ZKM0_9MICO|nr:hypothetical protein [Microbacterium amylolyticum]MBP2437568.1 hypothetical protein [Microbacterium amylolyticum]